MCFAGEKKEIASKVVFLESKKFYIDLIKSMHGKLVKITEVGEWLDGRDVDGLKAWLDGCDDNGLKAWLDGCDDNGGLDDCDDNGGLDDCDDNGGLDDCDDNGGLDDCDDNGGLDGCNDEGFYGWVIQGWLKCVGIGVSIMDT